MDPKLKQSTTRRLKAAERGVTIARKLAVAALRDAGRAERELLAAWKEYLAARASELEDSPEPAVIGSDADQWLDLVGEIDHVRHDGTSSDVSD